ncbi:MAG: flagellar hook-length control protein FliK [Halothiobacillus sp.]
MATMNSVIAGTTPATSPRSDSNSSGSLKAAQGNNGDFAQLMTGAIQAQTAAPANSADGTGLASTSTAIKIQAAASGDITDAQAQCALLQAKINTLLTQSPPLTAQAQEGLKSLQQQLAVLTSAFGLTSGQTSNNSTFNAKTLTDLRAQLDQLQTLLAQHDLGSDAWSTQVQAAALNFGQWLSQAAPQATFAQTGVNSHSDLLNQYGMTVNQKNNGLTPQHNNPSTVNNAGESSAPINNANQSPMLSVATQTIAAQIASVPSLISPAKGQANQGLTAQLPDTPSLPASGLPSGLTAVNMPSAGFGSIAGNSVWTTLAGTLDLNQPKMAADMGQHIQWMVGKNMSRATLEINPANLGPLKITIDQQRDQIQIQIMASHHLTRDVLDQAMPRLREWLQDAGLSNAQVSVTSNGQDSAQNQTMGQDQNTGQSSGFGQSSSGNGQGIPHLDSSGIETDNGTSVEGALQKINSVWRLDTFV